MLSEYSPNYYKKKKTRVNRQQKTEQSDSNDKTDEPADGRGRGTECTVQRATEGQ